MSDEHVEHVFTMAAGGMFFATWGNLIAGNTGAWIGMIIGLGIGYYIRNAKQVNDINPHSNPSEQR